MISYTLFVFEGVTERNILDNLKKFFIDNQNNSLVYATFGHNIYQLCAELEEDSYLDLHSLLCESIDRRDDPNKEIERIPRDRISDIYLFFDYDPHTTNANDINLFKMLDIFDNSQNNGKLFINYPMLESIRHIPARDFTQVTYPISALVTYKNYLKLRDEQNRLINVIEDFFNWGLYRKEDWKDIIEINLGRANSLVYGSADLPAEPIEQIQILNAQKNTHIHTHRRVSVINAFPLMLHEYYGTNIWSKVML